MKIARKLAVAGVSLSMALAGIVASSPAAHASYVPCTITVRANGYLVPSGSSGPASCWLSTSLQGYGLWGVKALQARLRALGYAVTVDGYYGPQTASAVYRFQARRGIQADGVYFMFGVR
ncbi:MAG: peptidoglycan-binding domain-containing protein [Actinomycetia bacterium]|nr:peptidoglycan-binding domain-containing protein [Actinomycetes bacterium]